MPFLTATWKNLIVINYEIDPEILAPYIPIGCELDSHEGKTFVSLVAFQFLDNAFLGVVPTFPTTDFEEANLRFYIRRVVDGETRRAVAFIREVVPSRMIALIARTLYNEPYVTHPMAFHQQGSELAYRWGADCELMVRTEGELESLQPDSHEHFILEHYWGYTAQVDGRTCEYRVEHPPWRFQRVATCQVSASVPEFYGEPFRSVLMRAPVSAFVAEGSPISVSTPRLFRGQLNMTSAPADGATGMKVWWSSPLGYLFALPILRWLTWRFYKLFNRNRLCVSKLCRLPQQRLEEETNDRRNRLP